MIKNAPHLATFISNHLRNNPSCRIYQDALDAVWFHPQPDGRSRQAALIEQFARKHGWSIAIHTPGGYGIVADFTAARPEQESNH